MKNLSERISQLSPEQQAFLAKRLKDKRGAVAARSAISRQEGANSYPLSFAQQRLWFLEQMQPGLLNYHIRFAFRLAGGLEVLALQRSLEEVARRHTVLRTTFTAGSGEPRQVISENQAVGLPVVDLQLLPVRDRETTARRLMAELASQAFDLARGPLLRAALFRLGPHDHILILATHHIIFDGWSISIFTREVTALYKAFLIGRASPLPEPTLQYGDYAAWQRMWLQGETLGRQLAHWQQALADAPTLDLPLDKRRPAAQTYAGGTCGLVLSRDLTSRLERIHRHAGVTVFMTLLAAFKALLYRYTGQVDVVVGSPIAGRSSEQVEGLIGFFVNILVLRTDASGDPSFGEFLERVRSVCLGAYAHQDVPFEKLVAELQLDRDLSRNPLFQALFMLQNFPQSGWELPGLTMSSIEIDDTTTKFDLAFVLEHTHAGLEGTIGYNTDLFYPTTIARMADHFLVLLEAIADTTELRLSELPLLTKAERHMLLVEWNNAEIGFAGDTNIQQLFELQAEQNPERIAILFEAVHVTYTYLNHKANQLVHQIQRSDVSAGQPVAVLLGNGPLQIIALLGILKAGCSFVCLEPDGPVVRTGEILREVEPACLLSESQYADRYECWRQSQPAPAGRVLTLDTDLWPPHARPALTLYRDDRTEAQPIGNPTLSIDPQSPAYIAYTSGSTGSPKGIVESHNSFCQFIEWFSRQFELHDAKRVAQWASIVYDAAYCEIFGALCFGATICMANQATRYDPSAIITWVGKEQIAVLQTVPSFFRRMVQVVHHGAPADRPSLASLDLVLLAGEMLPIDLAAEWVDRCPNRPKLYNQYGPTETILATYTPIENVSRDARSISIGKAIPGRQILILDQHQHVCPIGVRGEIYIRSQYLTIGYFRRPEETRSVFIQNPLHNSYSDPVYRTGDYARWMQNGEIEFYGRSDNQVKLRGMRIELEDIEFVLGSNPQIRESAVTVKKYSEDEQQLVAYIVAPDRPTAPQLRSFLKGQLPDYMIPTAFVFLDALPTTPTGKIDRRNLPSPDGRHRTQRPEFIAASTALEALVVAAWQRLLSKDRISIYDNFFELGGHSILAVQLSNKLRESCGIDIPVRWLFEAPTVAELAQRIADAQEAMHRDSAAIASDKGKEQLSAIPRRRHAQPAPLSFAQQRLWFLDQLAPGNPAYNVRSAYRLLGALDLAVVERCINEIVRRHEVLRTIFAVVERRPVQMVADRQIVQPMVVDFQYLPQSNREAVIARFAAQETLRPFDLERGPLVRLALLRLSDQEHILLLAMHHSISDLWSVGIFNGEFAALYNAYSEGRPSPLHELPIQYADYAIWQREWLRGEVLSAQLSYWKQQLQDAHAVLELPTDRPRPAVQQYQGAAQALVVDEHLTRKLKDLTQRARVTPYMTLLAAWKTLLYRYTGQTSIVVGSTVAGRNRAEFEHMIGFFVNTLALHTRFSRDMSFDGLLRQVHEEAVGAYAHQELPFERLVEELQPQRDLSHNPLFQVLFTLQNTPTEMIGLRDLTVLPTKLENQTSIFDLTLLGWEAPEQIHFVLEYNTDLFDATTIVRLLRHFERLLEGIVAAPATPVSRLPLLTASERHQLLVSWNATATSVGTGGCIHELFAQQAAYTPDTSAVVYAEQHLTYGELQRRANQLAHELRRYGVGPDVCVGVCIERSLDLIVGLLGILSAGGAYVPLDPSYPSERISFMLEDSGAAVVIVANDELSDKVTRRQADKERSDLPVSHTLVDLRRDWPAIARQPATRLDSHVRDDNLAYMIYTSGSTGTPKGALLGHRGLTNRLAWMQHTFRLTPNDSILQKTPASFDVSVWELFWPLLSGARLVLAQPGAHGQSTYLRELLARQRITVVHFVPSMLHVFLADLPPEDALALRALICSGEALSIDLQRRALAWLPGGVYNLYGPTEATIDVTCWHCQPASRLRSVPIGRPIANTQLYVLDAHLAPAPIAVAGELYIGGIQLGRGYHNRPELTAARFIPNPFAPTKDEGRTTNRSLPHSSFVIRHSSRLYRTGDLARYSPDGNLEYLGRIDQQIKLRGFRIELGEIEAVLRSHPALRDCAVAVQDTTELQRLVAYVVPTTDVQYPEGTQTNDERSEDKQTSRQGDRWPNQLLVSLSLGLDTQAPSFVGSLRDYLGQTLPNYMIPSAFVLLDTLPLTPNGKLDRKALPAPEPNRPELEVGFVAPQTPVEVALAGIWAEVLGIKDVGIHDNFFDLGGHSLLAMQVLSRIRETFQIELPLRNLFEMPTVLDISAMITQRVAEQHAADLDVVGRANDDRDPDQGSIQIEQLSDREVNSLLRDLLMRDSR